MKYKTSVVAAAIAASGLAFAGTAIAAAASHLPATHTQGEVRYLSGGIGKSEAAAMKHAARRYPLQLEFLLKAKPKEEYLADIKVQIKDAHDRLVLDAIAGGPFLLAKMPAGKYKVSADRDGKVVHRQIEIAASGHQRVVFEWLS